MIEQAEAFRRLRDDHSLSVKQITEKSGKTHQHIYDCLTLIDGPPSIQQAVRAGKVSATLAATAIKESETPEAAEETIEKGITAAASQGRSKATARHISTRKSRKASGSPASSIQHPASDLQAARRDLKTRDEDKARYGDASAAPDSIARLREIYDAVPERTANTTARDTLRFLIQYLQGHIPLTEAITFFKE